MPINDDIDDLEVEDGQQQGNYVTAGSLMYPGRRERAIGPHVLKADGLPVLAAAEEFLKEATAKSDLTNVSALRQLERVLKAIRVMKTIFRAPSDDPADEIAEDVAEHRFQSPSPVETFNSRLMREGLPLLTKILTSNAEKATADVRLRALDGIADARAKGDADLEAKYQDVINGLPDTDTGLPPFPRSPKPCACTEIGGDLTCPNHSMENRRIAAEMATRAAEEKRQRDEDEAATGAQAIAAATPPEPLTAPKMPANLCSRCGEPTENAGFLSMAQTMTYQCDKCHHLGTLGSLIGSEIPF